jgi:hypothetical protein
VESLDLSRVQHGEAARLIASASRLPRLRSIRLPCDHLCPTTGSNDTDAWLAALVSLQQRRPPAPPPTHAPSRRSAAARGCAGLAGLQQLQQLRRLTVTELAQGY